PPSPLGQWQTSASHRNECLAFRCRCSVPSSALLCLLAALGSDYWVAIPAHIWVYGKFVIMEDVNDLVWNGLFTAVDVPHVGLVMSQQLSLLVGFASWIVKSDLHIGQSHEAKIVLAESYHLQEGQGTDSKLLLCLLAALGSDYWVADSSSHMGLWKICNHGGCQSFGVEWVSASLHAVRTFMFLGMIAGAVSLGGLCIMDSQPRLAYMANFTAGLCAMIAMSIFSGRAASTSKYGWSFGWFPPSPLGQWQTSASHRNECLAFRCRVLFLHQPSVPARCLGLRLLGSRFQLTYGSMENL
ncbi:hypothetical protein E2320_000641, partial [Naja naja]